MDKQWHSQKVAAKTQHNNKRHNNITLECCE